MTSKCLVYVDGQEGTTGLKIHEMLAARDDVELLKIAPQERKDPFARAQMLNEAEVSFLCLPDSASREAVALVTNPKSRMIDASTAFRTDPMWAYGLPELCLEQRRLISNSKRVSNPGCHATAFVMLIRPLVDAGFISPKEVLSATSITGYSGGGKSMITAYQEAPDPELKAPRPYALGLSHKHLPEMTVHSGLSSAPIFMPIVGPYMQGLTVSVPLAFPRLEKGASGRDLHEIFSERYAGEHFVRVMPLQDSETIAHGFFDPQGSNETNRVDIFVFANDAHAILMARLDNLRKGASGAAIQNMNLLLGLDEHLGLKADA